MKTNHTLNGAFPIVAAALGDKFGIKIQIGGSAAYTDGEVINLPAYHLDDPGYKDIAWGYLAHEAGHVRFSDFTEINDLATSPIRKDLVNILEDIRIEKRMHETFPGTKYTIMKLDEHLFLADSYKLANRDSHPAAILSQFMLLRLSADVLGFSSLAATADRIGEVFKAVFPVAVVTRLLGLLAEVPALDSTRACVGLADRILQVFQDGQATPPEQTRRQAESPDGNPTQQGNGHAGQVLADILSATENDLPEDRSTLIQALLAGEPDGHYDWDVQIPAAMAPELDMAIGQQMLAKAMTETGMLRATLQGLVQASRHDRTCYKRSGSRLDGRRLTRLRQGDTRVFRRNSHRQAPNAAVDLVIDGSRSMGNEMDSKTSQTRMEVAMESTLALALALEAIPGVNPAVTRFPYKRTDAVVPLLKHGEKVRPNAAKFLPVTSGCTPLHKALWYAAVSVLSAPELLKIIMVLTDGRPDDLAATLAVIERCEAEGIKLVGIGIDIDTSHLFRKSVVIHKASDLKLELFKISSRLLMAA